MVMTPVDALLHQAKTRPESTAFIFHREAWTFRRLADEAKRVAHGLATAGVKAGDRAALQMMNRPEMLIAYFACLRLGAIAARLRTAFKFAELAPILRRLAPAIYIGDSDLYRLPRGRRFIVGAIDHHDGTLPWDVLRQDGMAELPSQPSYAPAVLINTSGTTGEPKFVTHKPDTLGATTDHTGDLMRRGEDDDLRFVSRKKDIVIHGGTNISPIEVEESLIACHPAVEEAAIVNKTDPVLGQRVSGFVKLASGSRENAVTEILHDAAKRLASYKVHADLRVVEALPRNALSKINRKAAQTMIYDDETIIQLCCRASLKQMVCFGLPLQ